MQKVSIAQRGGKLYLRFFVSGREIKRSSGLSDTQANRTFLQREVVPDIQRRILLGEFGEKRAKNSVNSYIDLLLKEREGSKSYREFLRCSRRVRELFGERDIGSIKKIELREWVASLKLKYSSIMGLLAPLRMAFELALDDEVIERNPMEGLKIPRSERERVEPFSKEEVDKLLAHSSGLLKRYLMVAFYTGARTGEIIALKWSDIDFTRGVISIERAIREGRIGTPKTKSGVRLIPLFAPLKEFLLSIERESEWIFPKRDGGSFYSRSEFLSPRQWQMFLELLGIEYRQLYQTRHSFATHMLLGGKVGVLEVSRMLGHADATMTLRVYAKYIKGEELKIARSIDPFAKVEQ